MDSEGRAHSLAHVQHVDYEKKKGIKDNGKLFSQCNSKYCLLT